jgi:tetratricopeptide (TPR) repeat protein
LTQQVLRLFVSSPGDVPDERRRVDLVVERLNTEFEGRVRIETIRWETSYYSAHDTFQKQIPEAADCDVVVAVFRGRLGTPLPAGFPPLPTGEPYPSGTAYEVLSAIEMRKAGKGQPDVYVFRYPNAPSVLLDAPDRAEIELQWVRLKSFFDTWFRTKVGEFVAAFQTYASTDEFATKVEDCLRQWLARRGFMAQGPVWDRVLHGSPFPGLAAFGADRGSVFFGRDLAVAQSIERLREAAGVGGKRLPFLLVIGASGSGKSSLLRAGLLPRLTQPGTIPEIDLWRTAIVTPGPDPFLSLAESLFADAALGLELRQGTFRTKEILARQLAGDPDMALAPLRDALDKVAERRRSEAQFEAARPVRLALAVDQAERLFVEADGATAAAFAALLAALVRQNLAYLVMVLRSDAYARFQGSEALVGLREAGATFDLVPPTAAELEEIVSRPVAACHPPLAFEQREGRSLAALLVGDAKGGDALPLMQMTLARLYATEAGRGDGLLRFADYRGMDAAVTETANEALDTLDEAARAELPALVAGLVADVAADPLTGEPLPVVAALDRNSFEAQKPARQALVEAFVAKRLLTAEGDGFSQRVRPVHEALLRIWPQAVAIVGETASLIRVRHTLEPMVREWQGAGASDKAGHLEISPALLDGAQQLLSRMGDDLPPAMRDFIAQAAAADAARRDRQRQEQERRIRDAEALLAANRRITRRTLVGLAAAIVLAVLAGWQWRNAKTERDHAQHSLALATQTANGLVFDLAQKFENVVGVPAATIKDILDRARQLQDQLLASGESSPDLRRSQAEALGETAATLLKVGDTQGALAAAQQERDIFQALLAQQPDSNDFKRELSVSHMRVGMVLETQSHLPEALQSYRAAQAISDGLAKAFPGDARVQRDLSVSYQTIGDVLGTQGHLPEALQSFQASLAIMDRLAKSDRGNVLWQRDLALLYGRIGVVETQGHLPEALQSFQAALAIRERLAKSDLDNAQWQSDLSLSYDEVGNVEIAQGHLPEALQSYQASLAIAERLAKSDRGNARWQRNLASSYEEVGDVLRKQGHLPEALQSYQAALAIHKTLTKSDPGNTEWQSGLSASYKGIGDVLEAQGHLPEALQSYQASLAILEPLVKSDVAYALWQRDLSVLHEDIGDVLKTQGHLPEALQSYQAGQAISDSLAKSNPSNAEFQRKLSVSYDRVGDVEVSEGHLPEALQSYQASLAIAERLAKSDLGNAGWQRDLSVSYNEVGDVLRKQGHLPEALQSFQASLAIRKPLAKSNPGNAEWQRDLSVSYDDVGGVEVSQGHLPEALQSYQASLAIIETLAKSDPGNAGWQSDLRYSIEKLGGMAYRFLLAHDFAKALEAADQSISLAPDLTWLYTNRAHALMFLGRIDEARAIYLKYRGQKTQQGDDIWETAIRNDFAELRKAGLTNPLMDEIETLFAAAK